MMPGDEQSGGNTRGMKDTEEWISRGIKEESYSLAKSNNIANMQCHINSLPRLGYRKGKATKNATKKASPTGRKFFQQQHIIKIHKHILHKSFKQEISKEEAILHTPSLPESKAFFYKIVS